MTDFDTLVQEAQRRGYLTVDEDKGQITYHCRRNVKYNYRDPEEKVRARTYSWLIIQKSYSPQRMDLEVRVPRRTPNDWADIVVYSDDACRKPYLVVENKEELINSTDQAQGVEQGFGNANSLRAPFMLFDYGNDSSFFDVTNFDQAERTANRLGRRDTVPESYGAPSTFPLVANGMTDIAPVSAGELERRVRRAHALIWAGGKRDPLTSFDEWSKLLFAKIYDERHTPNGKPRQFQCGVGETATQVANRIRALFATARRRDPSVFTSAVIDLPDDKIRDVVQAVQEVGLSLMPIDGLGHAFEHFFGSIFRGELGQYFTHRELVRFMVAMVRPTDEDFVLDPTCGSGGFLLETLLQVWHYIDTYYAGQPDVERRKYDFAHENLFGIEIHSILGRVCQTNLLLHKDGHTNVETDRTCLDTSFINPQIRPDGSLFSVILGNPPFGDKIKEGDTDALGANSLRAFEMGNGYKQVKSELVILERAFAFLRPGGRLAMVVPDGLLNNAGELSQCPAFRRLLLRTARIDAIVSLPDHAFRKSGAQNKTSILFATRFTADERAVRDRLYEEELQRLRESNGGAALSAGELALEAEAADDENGGKIPVAALAEAHLAIKALEAVAAQFDYPIFLAEAD
jgi:type I restriction enzyme M protein